MLTKVNAGIAQILDAQRKVEGLARFWASPVRMAGLGFSTPRTTIPISNVCGFDLQRYT
jgi:hypothetical protein